jgi:hypothetical protein
MHGKYAKMKTTNGISSTDPDDRASAHQGAEHAKGAHVCLCVRGGGRNTDLHRKELLPEPHFEIAELVECLTEPPLCREDLLHNHSDFESPLRDKCSPLRIGLRHWVLFFNWLSL